MYEKMGMQLAAAAMLTALGSTPAGDYPLREIMRKDFDALDAFLPRSRFSTMGSPNIKKKKTKNRKNKAQRRARKNNR